MSAKPMDLSNLLRHAFMTGAGVKDGQRIPADVQSAWVVYDPSDVKFYQRINDALYGGRS